jgi:hypothetical protein
MSLKMNETAARPADVASTCVSSQTHWKYCTLCKRAQRLWCAADLLYRCLDPEHQNGNSA